MTKRQSFQVNEKTRKNSDNPEDDSIIIMEKRISTNSNMSVASRSTAFSYNSAKLISEGSLLTPPSHQSNETSPAPSSRNYTEIMMERYN